jgi:hypothetical protein
MNECNVSPFSSPDMVVAQTYWRDMENSVEVAELFKKWSEFNCPRCK